MLLAAGLRVEGDFLVRRCCGRLTGLLRATVSHPCRTTCPQAETVHSVDDLAVDVRRKFLEELLLQYIVEGDFSGPFLHQRDELGGSFTLTWCAVDH